jgi:hypothetical protein
MGIFVGGQRDPAAHTVIIILQLRKIPGVFAEPGDPGTPIPSAVPPPQAPTPPLPLPPGPRRPRP